MANGNKDIAKYGENTRFTSGCQAVENGKKGGKASAKNKKQKKTFAEIIKQMLDTPVTDQKQLAAIEKGGLPVPDDPTYKDFLTASVMIKTIQKGRVEDLEKLSEIIGETNEDAAALEKLDEVLNKIGGVTNNA